MKKYLYLGIAIAGIMSSCSNTYEPTIEDLLAENPIVSGDVEINLGAGNATRASINSDENGIFETDNIGIFCLAQESMNINPHELPISWDKSKYTDRSDNNTDPTKYSQYTYEYSAWLENKEAKAVIETINGVKTTRIHWADNSIQYYPTGNWHRYAFYGYYPYQPTTKFSINEEIRQADFDINGHTDILWGKGYKQNEKYAYSAIYFRDPSHQNKTAEMQFKHSLMRLTFSCITGELENEQGDKYVSPEAKKMYVVSVKVLKLPTKGHLVVANRLDPTKEGVFTADWKNNLKDVLLTEEDDTEIKQRADHTYKYKVETTAKRIGDGIICAVPDDPNYNFYVEVVLAYDKDGDGVINEAKGDKYFHPEHPMQLNSNVKFEAGKSYNLKLTVNAPEQMSISATLEPWEEQPEGSINNIIL